MLSHVVHVLHVLRPVAHAPPSPTPQSVPHNKCGVAHAGSSRSRWRWNGVKVLWVTVPVVGANGQALTGAGQRNVSTELDQGGPRAAALIVTTDRL